MKRILLTLISLTVLLIAPATFASDSLFLKCSKLEKNNTDRRIAVRPETKTVEITSKSAADAATNIYDSAFTMWDATVIISKLQERLFVTIVPKNSNTESMLSASIQQIRQPTPITISTTTQNLKNKKLSTTISCVVSTEP